MEEKKEARYEAVRVPTEFQNAIQTPSGEVLSDTQLLVEIANKIDKLSLAIVGKQ